MAERPGPDAAAPDNDWDSAIFARWSAPAVRDSDGAADESAWDGGSDGDSNHGHTSFIDFDPETWAVVQQALKGAVK